MTHNSNPQLISGGPIENYPYYSAPSRATHVMLWEIDGLSYPVFVRKLPNKEQVWEDNTWHDGLSRAVALREHKNNADSVRPDHPHPVRGGGSLLQHEGRL